MVEESLTTQLIKAVRLHFHYTVADLEAVADAVIAESEKRPLTPVQDKFLMELCILIARKKGNDSSNGGL